MAVSKTGQKSQFSCDDYIPEGETENREQMTKKMINLFPGQEERHRCKERTCGHGGGRGVRMNWETVIDIHIPPSVKQIATG